MKQQARSRNFSRIPNRKTWTPTMIATRWRACGLRLRRRGARRMLVESTAGGMGEGRANAPQRDWKPERLGPSPPDAMVQIADSAFGRMLAACGCSPALFDDSRRHKSKREALRQWHLGTVQPLARLLEAELEAKLETRVRLRFDLYNLDLAGRAQAFQKLVAGGVDPLNEALVKLPDSWQQMATESKKSRGRPPRSPSRRVAGRCTIPNCHGRRAHARAAERCFKQPCGVEFFVITALSTPSRFNESLHYRGLSAAIPLSDLV